MNDSKKTSDYTNVFLNKKDFNTIARAFLKVEPPEGTTYIILSEEKLTLQLKDDDAK